MEPGKDLGRASQRYLRPARQLLQCCCCCFYARRNQYEVRIRDRTHWISLTTIPRPGISKKCHNCFEFAWRLPSTRKPVLQPYMNICPRFGRLYLICCAVFAKSKISTRQCLQHKLELPTRPTGQLRLDRLCTSRRKGLAQPGVKIAYLATVQASEKTAI